MTNPRPVKPPDLYDVARLAGVSHQTVSRVVNSRPNVRAETRLRVQQAIAELGYRPNVAAVPWPPDVPTPSASSPAIRHTRIPVAH